ncbi:EAL domain-containing protein [Fusibacter sp. 3D3]|uniref:bifunctional diguanylate cyclase/phosphodiesterase n=1 Tax=Fusibacter sp. 3D3 TaxID=1048380 RepID=UPI00085392D6|nr:EAL domain-containing protein [Fusibacter sp. 3D3]GAU79524.1 diguanylate cyclase/phosphodiesterase [Fusibacter sp. 3D3]
MLLRKKIPFVSIIIMAFSLLIMNTVYYAYISDILIRDNKDKMNQVLDMESVLLETFFDMRKLEVNYLANDALVIKTIKDYLNDPEQNDPNFRPQYDALNAFFENITATRKDIQAVFVLTPSGRTLASSHPESYWLDLSDRQYFLDAMAGKTAISKLLVDRIDNRAALFVATPIYNDDKSNIIGVLANIIDTTYASESIHNLVDVNVGNAYLIDQSGMIIFHTDQALIGTRHTNSDIDDFFKSSDLSIPNNSQFQKEKTIYYIAYKAIPNTPWIIVIDQNMDFIMRSADQALNVMLAITVTVLLFSATIAFLFSRQITIPITELSHVMHKTTRGDLSARSHYISQNELGELSNDLNYMLDELTGAYEEIESKNDVLTATEEELRHNYEQLEQSQTALKTIQGKYETALNASRDVVWEWDYESNHFFASEVWHELTGLDTYNTQIDEVAFEELLQKKDHESILSIFREHWRTHSPLLTFTFSYVAPTNKVIYFLVRANTQWDVHGNPIKTSGIMVDVTYEKETSDRIHNLAFNNQVTSLPNRQAYILNLKAFIESDEAVRCNLTVFQMDIDNFMRVNDALGHPIGDELLKALAHRLTLICNEDISVYHLSADEFAFILYDISKETEIAEIISTLYLMLNEPFIINQKSIYVSMSTGISVYPNDGDTVNKLIQNADTAMFTAKHTGKSNYVFYTNLLSEFVQKKLDMDDLLRRSIRDKLISMHYQPQYATLSRKLNSFEALMRITTEDSTAVSPADFIPVAEENGQIIELGEWALQEVCRTIRELLDLGYHFEHISVNVSSIQLQQPHFVDTVIKMTQLYDIEPKYLELEVTESVLLSVLNEHDNTLSTLRNMGYKIALDDFGTGYSSFSYLRTMPLSTLKIDKTFIDDLADSKKDQELVRQMIELSHELGIKVIAEGVETRAQYQILKDRGCDYIQGYYFSKPLSLEKTKELLTASANH